MSQYVQASHLNDLEGHRKIDALTGSLNQANMKLDETKMKLDDANKKLDETKMKLDEANKKLDEANKKLDMLLCPFELSEPKPLFIVLGQGCDGVDQDCNKRTDECAEDRVPPTIMLTHPIPSNPFRSVTAARTFLLENFDVEDDCAANIVTTVDLASGATCTDCTFVVTATDQRCMKEPEGQRGAPIGTRMFTIKVDSKPPVVTCGFFTPQDIWHVAGFFDPCLGVSPPYPPENDLLHIDANAFDKDFIDVAFWYQITVRGRALFRNRQLAHFLTCSPILFDN